MILTFRDLFGDADMIDSTVTRGLLETLADDIGAGGSIPGAWDEDFVMTPASMASALDALIRIRQEAEVYSRMLQHALRRGDTALTTETVPEVTT